jgi:thioredoxin reductase (NADPH)
VGVVYVNDADVYDVTIIGSGPTGLFAAFYAGLRSLKTKIIEALPEAGGQLAVLYPEKYIYDAPGFPKVLAKDLVIYLKEQTAMFGPTMVYGERVDTLTRTFVGEEEVWRLGSEASAHLSRTAIITAGIGAFVPNRLDRPGVAEFDGNGVYYFVQDKRPFRGKRILIIGGGDTAIDWALNLKDWAQSVTLIHRRDEFRAHEASLVELRSSPVTIRTFWELKRINGNGQIESATIYDNRTGEEDTLPVDIILINIGFKAALGPINYWGLELSDNRHIRTDGLMETNLPGIFAAGDIAAMEGTPPLNLIVTGFAQAAIAANAAKMRLDPQSRLFPGHSSEMRL